MPSRWLAVAAFSFAGIAAAQDKFVSIQGAACATPPVLHCPDSECPGPVVINQGPVVEMKTRRTYFLDYPCDLKPDEPVTFIMSLHGGGSYGNWQRHYMPIMDYKDKHRLVIATPHSPIRAWSEVDDAYLQNIVEFVVAQIGKENIKSFWLVGHSQGGATSNRLLRTDFFKARVDGFLSLSGGRIGGAADRGDFNATIRPEGLPPRQTPALAGARPGQTAARPALPLHDADFSHIFATGEREVGPKGIPAESEWAKKYNCGARNAPIEVVDTRAGYIYDSSRIGELRPAWGLLPAPGKATISVYPNCKDGRVVADVVRLNKGHTEGLEPRITEELIKLMVSAPGGKIKNNR